MTAVPNMNMSASEILMDAVERATTDGRLKFGSERWRVAHKAVAFAKRIEKGTPTPLVDSEVV